jgi:hypothetical protein
MRASARKWIRVGLAGPMAVISALVMMAGMTQWLPGGDAGIDNLVLPLLLVPLLWAGFFFHACLDSRLSRVAILSIGLTMVHAGMVADRFVNSAPGPAQALRP